MSRSLEKQAQTYGIFENFPAREHTAAVTDVPADLLAAPGVAHTGRAFRQADLDKVGIAWGPILKAVLPMVAGGMGGDDEEEDKGVPTVSYMGDPGTEVVASRRTAQPVPPGLTGGGQQPAQPEQAQQELPVHLWDPDNQGPACGVDEPLNVTSQEYQVTCVECQVAQQRKQQEMAAEQQEAAMAQMMAPVASRRRAEHSPDEGSSIGDHKHVHQPLDDLDELMSEDACEGYDINIKSDTPAFTQVRKKVEDDQDQSTRAAGRVPAGEGWKQDPPMWDTGEEMYDDDSLRVERLLDQAAYEAEREERRKKGAYDPEEARRRDLDQRRASRRYANAPKCADCGRPAAAHVDFHGRVAAISGCDGYTVRV